MNVSASKRLSNVWTVLLFSLLVAISLDSRSAALFDSVSFYLFLFLLICMSDVRFVPSFSP